MAHDHSATDRDGSLKTARDARKGARRTAQQHDFSRADFFHDLGRVSQRLTREIEKDPAQAAALDRSREQARQGKLISQEELDAEDGEG